MKSVGSTLLFLMLVGASATASAQAMTGATTNPCKLVTAADAKTALGTAVGKTTPKPAGLCQDCTYKTSSGKTLIVLTRKISKSDFVKSAKANPGASTAVAGIGSSAFSIGTRTLLVWKNGTEAAFSIFNAARALQIEETLAKRVVSRF